ncbi:TPA: hypothetical protein ACN32D_002133 [Vibrio parahaemolyticus]|uniref:Uncharacterized protein n=3 Tax=Vibrio TaxID=662 RepID=A0A1Q9HRQ3_9VIBR|nr:MULTISPECIES: hypothetical protein [Vibrio]KIT46453.1 hypothetical protein H337_06960 [Vibrio parahaemolyticus EN9701121]EGQ9863080.1 hypothetical protein [Vibrio parahaemolyticus]EGW0142863.1 hypothetical protein [Vibrio parahaemolyticus]EHB9909293.1 hypothetical protein [Vibrio parahaemolyticus]EIA1794259.1 hypothetical protein [Vibrio parahaemolyticus]
MNNNYFQELLDKITKASNENLGKKMAAKFKFQDVLTLAKQEIALNKAKEKGTEYSDTESGKQYLAVKKAFIDMLGEKPTDEIVASAFNESIFDKLEFPSDTPNWQRKAFVKIGKADQAGDLQVRSLGKQFLKLLSNKAHKLNPVEIDVDINTPLQLLLHLMGDGLKFDTFFTQQQSFAVQDTKLSESKGKSAINTSMGSFLSTNFYNEHSKYYGGHDKPKYLAQAMYETTRTWKVASNLVSKESSKRKSELEKQFQNAVSELNEVFKAQGQG